MRLGRRGFLTGLAGFAALPAQAAPRLMLGDDDGLMRPSTAAWLEIDREAFAANIRFVRKAIGPDPAICAVMKGDAYGHGMGLLIPAVIAEGIGMIGVTSNDEARVARAEGYAGRILRLMTAPVPEILDGRAYDMEETIGNLEVARQCAAAARQSGRRLKAHVMLNSAGMSRNGIELATDEGRRQATELVRLDGLEIVGLMTHFPLNDADDMGRGLDHFRVESDWLMRRGGLERRHITLHAANSFATMGFADARLDMVRPGGALYGDTDTVPDASGLLPVMALKTRVAAVNAYPKGNTVTYGRTATLTRDSLLANLPIGYSDGYDRRFSNAAHVLVQGRRAPVIGRVTMNTTMVDVTDIPGVRAGDEVVLYGAQGAERIGQAELETITNSIFITEYTLWGNSLPKILK
jgi:alanine racemase